MIKSDYATITFVEVEFEIPPRQRGEVTTVEGLLRSSAERLGEAQDIRMEQAPEVCVVAVGLHRLAITTFVERLRSVQEQFVDKLLPIRGRASFSPEPCRVSRSSRAHRCQPRRQIGLKVAQVIAKLTMMCAGFDSEFPFTMVVDDPSGNSFVENPSAPNKDPALSVSRRYISRNMIGGFSASCSSLP